MVRRFVGTLMAVWGALCVLPGAAHAGQRINVDVFRPAAHPGDLTTASTTDIPDEGIWSAGAIFHYGKNPLVFVDPTATLDHQRQELIRDLGAIDLLGSYRVHHWVDLAMALPIYTMNEGDRDGFIEHEEISTKSLGDLRLSPKVRILSRAADADGYGLAADLLMVLPTGDASSFVSDGFSMQPTLLADYRVGPWIAVANLGYRIRSSEAFLPRTSGDGHLLEVDNEMMWRLGTAVRILGERRAAVNSRGVELEAVGELHGASSDFGSENATFIEGLFGARLGIPDAGLTLHIGGGSGLVKGYGNTKFRIYAGLTYTPATNRDQDFDGMLDEDDKCPLEPEDFDSYQDDDGCPDPDNDGDKVLDARDRCPNDAEDVDGFQDIDGCPELDNDGDGVLDAQDDCPLEAEDHDGFQDKDGCPDNDNDEDGIPDSADRCPTEPESRNGHQDDDGCPDETLARIGKKRIIILDRVYFAFKKEGIKPQSFPVLTAVAGILKANPKLRVRVDGYTDGRGPKAMNLRLSQARAEAVVTFLKEAGIAADRLEAVGHGKKRPAQGGGSPEARSANRRVEFVILSK